MPKRAVQPDRSVQPERAVQPDRSVQPNSPQVPTREELFREWSVGQLADRSGLSISALHFYERKGLISSTRNEGNQRRFSREMLRRLAFIRASQSLGIPLTEIGEALATLPQQRTPNEADWTVLAEGWREVLDARMGLLERLRDDLTSCIGCGCLSFERCKIVNPADRLSVEGPGARRLMPGTTQSQPH